jgi:RimJ/RimL family protein N-acetyltransferase
LVTLDRDSVARMLAGETPGPGAILAHVATTGHGRAWADQWPSPSALLVEVGGNYLLAGAPEAVEPAALRPLVTGFLAAPEQFAPVVAEAFPDRTVWDRIIHRLPAGQDAPPPGPASGVRALNAADTDAVAGLSPELAWVAKTWGGPAGLASRAHAYGAFVDGRLVAVAGTFFLGARHEDAVVATEPRWRWRGLATACARAWCAGVVARGRTPTWTTSPDNLGSRRIAERLGLELVRRDVLHVVNVDVPG